MGGSGKGSEGKEGGDEEAKQERESRGEVKVLTCPRHRFRQDWIPEYVQTEIKEIHKATMMTPVKDGKSLKREASSGDKDMLTPHPHSFLRVSLQFTS